ncbi:MAG: ABC transporter ATP-binding protein [Lachnospiraceae bacterium]|nr:ABC transporter ATP-binding protein [Lachnospiraceae bacterium]
MIEEKTENKSTEKDKDKTTILPFFGFPRLFPYMKKYRGKIIFMIIIGGVVSFIDTLYPMFSRYALNNFVAEKDLSKLQIFIITYVALLIIQSIMSFVTIYFCAQVELFMNRDLRSAAFNHLQELSFSYFNQNNVGYIHARVMSDSGKIGALTSWHIMDMVWNGTYLIGMLILMLVINWKLALYVLILVPIAIVIITFFQKKLIGINRKIREINSTITSDFNEGITGAKSIKTLAVEDKMEDDFEKDTMKMKRTAVHSMHYSALFTSLVTMMSSIALSLVLWRGGIITMHGVMEIGTLSVFLTYAINMMEPIQNLIGTLSEIIAVQVNVERLVNLLETESDVSDTPEVIEKYGDTFNQKKENWEDLYGDVKFSDVTFRYPDGDEDVLEHFNLDVPKGTSVAIVGETGAGKSTLVNLICRFFTPTSGQILIDGKDARERSQGWLHNNIGYVLQTPHLFSGTVRENLRYGKPDATDEEIMEAIKMVAAEGVIEKMPDGLNSDVGEGGDMLSTGEKQLLSFARALLSDPRILILDEATASIDTVTEKAIQNAITVITKDRTSFVIAHRLSTIVDSDVILVVSDGKIIERGNHSELMANQGHYYDLFTRQYVESV